MMEGKVRSAFRLLARGGQSGILTLNQTSVQAGAVLMPLAMICFRSKV